MALGLDLSKAKGLVPGCIASSHLDGPAGVVHHMVPDGYLPGCRGHFARCIQRGFAGMLGYQRPREPPGLMR